MPKILKDLRPRLLQEVEILLAQGGYAAVTIRSVAEGCGVGVGTVYNYFPSKEAMVAQLLLADWQQRIESIQAVTGGGEAVARCICEKLRSFAASHAAIFRDEAARGTFAGSFSQYHTLLRSQLAAPLRPHCPSDFAADFAAEALLTWTMAGREFPEIWEMLAHLVS